MNQFHDILPGSSITEVYQDSEEQYREVKQWGEKAVDAALAELAAGVMLPQRGLVVFNSLGWQRRDLIALPWQEEYADKHLTDLSGRPLQVQVVNEGGEEKLLGGSGSTAPSATTATCGRKEKQSPPKGS